MFSFDIMFIFVLKFITVDLKFAWFPHGKHKIKQYQGERRKNGNSY